MTILHLCRFGRKSNFRSIAAGWNGVCYADTVSVGDRCGPQRTSGPAAKTATLRSSIFSSCLSVKLKAFGVESSTTNDSSVLKRLTAARTITAHTIRQPTSSSLTVQNTSNDSMAFQVLRQPPISDEAPTSSTPLATRCGTISSSC